ncbi:MAG TPA: hypothetical protein VJU34_13785, partial [Phenylobacterium sp.]|nr:hypothetical protein [Phenylobacterium sp.]
RSRRVALAADEAAARLDGQVWVYFDHPAVAFADPPRWALAAFVDQVLRSANLRVVLAGYELLQLPGEAFENPPPPGSAGGRGLVVEYLNGFRRGDVEALVERAAGGLGRTLSPERVDELTDEAIEGLHEVGGVYDAWQGAAVSDRLRARLA